MKKADLIEQLDSFPDDMDISIFDLNVDVDGVVTEYEIEEIFPWISDDKSEQKIVLAIDSSVGFEEEPNP
jgi:hypothetical protein